MTAKQQLIKEAKRNLACLQAAVREELEKRAKLGLTAVVADAQGRPVHVPAAELVAQLHAQEKKSAKAR